VLLNCGASVPAWSATKWPSHPRAEYAGSVPGERYLDGGGGEAGLAGAAGAGLAAAGGFVAAGVFVAGAPDELPPAGAFEALAGAGWLCAAVGSGSGLSEFELR
jgi:hypothetical protein